MGSRNLGSRISSGLFINCWVDRSKTTGLEVETWYRLTRRRSLDFCAGAAFIFDVFRFPIAVDVRFYCIAIVAQAFVYWDVCE
jgi:hypothetical protein